MDFCGSLFILKFSERKLLYRQYKWKFITIDNPIEIPNFNCIGQVKQDTFPQGGVAIYQNNNSVTIL